MRAGFKYALTTAIFAATLSFAPATPAPAQINIFEKPAWEKDVRHMMWRQRSCVKLGSFIWEVGDAEKIISRDYSLKGTPPSATSAVPLHDVSALLFATYAAQVTKGSFTPDQIAALTMRSGYNAPMSQGCNIATTVGSCFGNLGGPGGKTGETGKFHYGPGHLQKMAMDLDLGSFRDGDMRDEYSAELGAPATHFQFETMRILDGLRMTPDNLSKFLRAFISDTFTMSSLLGQDAVCLDPYACPASASYAPSPRNRDYSLGHWVEKNMQTGAVEAYSATGKSGIYVWITADKKYYGYVIPREDGINRSIDGIACGRAMYRAVLRSAPQTAAPAPSTP
ncbi:MAG: hypothetical protein Q8K65_07115 [Alphaproteobacteria bacterium]|nr:hypothetical protein [Alphaproteobacteria bacterium]